MDRHRLLQYLEQFLGRRSDGLIAAYLYGSWGRGSATSRSDVDLGLLFEERPPAKLDSPPRQLESQLEVALGLPVQVVALNDAAPDLVHRVLRDGEIVLDRNPAARIRFEVRARNDYFDLLPILERYRRRKTAVT